MADRLRLLWSRPLRDGDRVRLFAIAVALIAGAAALLSRFEPPDPAGRSERTPDPSPAATAPASDSPVDAPPAAVPAEPTDEGTRSAIPVSRADVAAGKRAARRFLAGYFPYTYSRARARQHPVRHRGAAPTVSRAAPARARPRAPPHPETRSAAEQPGRPPPRRICRARRRRQTPLHDRARARAGWQVNRVGS